MKKDTQKVIYFLEIRYNCGKCGKSYKTKVGLYNHQKYECGKDPQFPCPHCPYRSKRKGNLKRHVLMEHEATKEVRGAATATDVMAILSTSSSPAFLEGYQY
uniref:C2H2-type domain-containing protein n=1 Tax=Rhodnius prolixus TaxID=13249 RepID=T1HQ17_RHOPR